MSGSEVCQHVALLLLQCRYHGHHALDKARAFLALGAKAALTPLHTRPDRPLRRVIGGFDTLDLHEGPQRLAPLQNLTACPLRWGRTTTTTPSPQAGPPPPPPAHISRETARW